MPGERMVRSDREKVIAGICGGIAEHFGLDPLLVRVAFLALVPASGLGVIIYLVLMLIMPRANQLGMPPGDMVQQNAAEFGTSLKEGFSRSTEQGKGRSPIGIFLILLGAYFLLQNLGWLGWLHGTGFWAVVIIGFGVYLLVRGTGASR